MQYGAKQEVERRRATENGIVKGLLMSNNPDFNTSVTTGRSSGEIVKDILGMQERTSKIC